MRTDSLSDRISKGISLTDEEIEDLLELLGKRCRAKTLGKLEFALRCVPDVSSWSIYDRVIIHTYANDGEDLGVTYCAGQSYPDEIRTVRQKLIKMH